MKEYKNDQIIVYWEPERCIHSKVCFTQLPEVMDPTKHPWININASTPEEIIKAIDKCPSGALKYSIPEGSSVDPEIARGRGNIDNKHSDSAEKVEIRVSANGPLLVEGPAVVMGSDGMIIKESERMALCRCGHSMNRPFCDGSHMAKGWKPDSKG